MNRLDALDWQRGLLALSIMVYHLVGWKLYEPGAGDLLGRLGIYGVSMFFVISGLSLAFVYGEYIHDIKSALRFFIRRVFRIWPLLWLAIIAVTAGKWLLGMEIDLYILFINMTTLFGFIAPDAYINTGAWSIGNEMVYYAMTPFIFYVFNRGLAYGNALLLLAVAVAGYFAFFLMSPAAKLSEQWSIYINPFNNLFFYCAGISMYYNFRKVEMAGVTVMLIFLCALAVFALYPAGGDLIGVVTGVERGVFSLASVVMVFCFFKAGFSVPTVISAPLSRLGMVTYGVYLLHPVVFQFIEILSGMVGLSIDPLLSIVLVVALTISAALVVYKWLELPLIRLGKRVTAR